MYSGNAIEYLLLSKIALKCQTEALFFCFFFVEIKALNYLNFELIWLPQMPVILTDLLHKDHTARLCSKTGIVAISILALTFVLPFIIVVLTHSK